MNAVSDAPIARAIAIISSALISGASSTMPARLPAPGSRVNASTIVTGRSWEVMDSG